MRVNLVTYTTRGRRHVGDEAFRRSTELKRWNMSDDIKLLVFYFDYYRQIYLIKIKTLKLMKIVEAITRY